MALDHDAPRPASTVLLLRDGVDGLEVLMVTRHQDMVFGSGAFVFPGGRVDTGDHAIAEQPDLCPDRSGLDAAAMSFRVAAIRETFEECGILLARSRSSGSLLDGGALQAIEASQRAPLCQGEITFADVLAVEELVLATDLLVPFAHWITPIHVPKRFDTLFFAILAPADQLAMHDGAEATGSAWVRPSQVLAETEAGRRKLLFPTQLNLLKLSQYQSAEHALEEARRAPVVTVQPELVGTEGDTRVLRIPLEAGYGGEIFRVAAPPM
jgi:8-oxo-dGTP pyrophosphatase MutT (NUDIX family)